MKSFFFQHFALTFAVLSVGAQSAVPSASGVAGVPSGSAVVPSAAIPSAAIPGASSAASSAAPGAATSVGAQAPSLGSIVPSSPAGGAPVSTAGIPSGLPGAGAGTGVGTSAALASGSGSASISTSSTNTTAGAMANVAAGGVIGLAVALQAILL
ncbi:hypothetical protein CPB84DRAFT_1779543, partial [Gymnopilus junonius]